MNTKILKNQKGIAPIIIAIIILVLLFLAGGAYILISRKITKGPQEGSKPPEIGIGKALEEIKITAPKLDFSLSPLKELKISAFNLAFPDFPSFSIFKGFSLNTDLSYKGDLNFSVPKVSLEVTQPEVPQPVPEIPETSPSELEVNEENCVQFSSIPSSQYCSSVEDANWRTLCEQCKAAGL